MLRATPLLKSRVDFSGTLAAALCELAMAPYASMLQESWNAVAAGPEKLFPNSRNGIRLIEARALYIRHGHEETVRKKVMRKAGARWYAKPVGWSVPPGPLIAKMILAGQASPRRRRTQPFGVGRKAFRHTPSPPSMYMTRGTLPHTFAA